MIPGIIHKQDALELTEILSRKLGYLPNSTNNMEQWLASDRNGMTKEETLELKIAKNGRLYEADFDRNQFIEDQYTLWLDVIESTITKYRRRLGAT